MTDYLFAAIAICVAFPFSITILVYGITKIQKKHTWKAIHHAVQWSSIFFILAVCMLLQLLFDKNFLGWIILLLILGLVWALIHQYRNQTEIKFSKAVKIVWRSSFLIFSSTYILLSCIYILKGML